MLIIKEESGLVLEDIDKYKDKKNLIGLILDKKDIFNLINMYIYYVIYIVYKIN